MKLEKNESCKTPDRIFPRRDQMKISRSFQFVSILTCSYSLSRICLEMQCCRCRMFETSNQLQWTI